MVKWYPKGATVEEKKIMRWQFLVAFLVLVADVLFIQMCWDCWPKSNINWFWASSVGLIFVVVLTMAILMIRILERRIEKIEKKPAKKTVKKKKKRK